MIYIIYYIIIGAIVTILYWFYLTMRKNKSHISENNILIFLPIMLVIWPVILGYNIFMFVYNKLIFFIK